VGETLAQNKNNKILKKAINKDNRVVRSGLGGFFFFVKNESSSDNLIRILFKL
jgi:hypothetical protein